MRKHLPNHCNLFTIHPIFGPQSGKNGITGLKCMFFNISCEGKIYQGFRDIFENDLGLQIFEISPEEHDKEMAYIQ
jgi:prephenate dehydrogenase